MEARVRAFLDFLNARRVGKNDPFTHVSKKGPFEDWFPGRYFIGSDCREEFEEKYQELVRGKVPLTLAEKPGPRDCCPLRVDVDFKADLSIPHRQYTRATITKLVKIYQQEIQKLVDPKFFECKMLWCIVLEKEAPRKEDDVIKDGFHIHFPHFICDAYTQDFYLRKRVLERATQERVWAGCNFITKPEDIIDEGMAKKAWMMYGSMNYKGKTSTPYSYSAKKGLGIALDDTQKEISLRKLFEDEMVGRYHRPDHYLPILLSIRGFQELTPLKKESVENFRDRVRQRKPQIVRTRSEADILKDLKFIEENDIIDMLSEERASKYDTWIRVGFALFNIGQGHEKALQMWIQFSKKDPEKFIEGGCEERWSHMSLGTLGMGSLLWWAKTDNPKEYKKNARWGLKNLLWHCLRTSKPTEYRVACVLNHKYKNRFRCAVEGKQEIWYEFPENGHRWKVMHGETSLRLLLPEDIAQDFKDLSVEIAEEYGKSREPGAPDDKRGDIYKKRCNSIIEKLETNDFQNKIVKQFKLFVSDDEFLDKLDMNQDLIGCENGILDLSHGVFRNGEPDDYVSLSTGLHFPKTKPPKWQRKRLDDFLKKIFPDPRLQKYFVDSQATCMPGNQAKIALIMTGGGNNGKSVTVRFLEMAYGQYCGKFPRELLVRGRGNTSGAARPELVRTRGKRLMICQEIGNDMDQMDIGVLKELTGKDTFYARGLWKDGQEIKPMFTVIIQCNDPPKIPGDDNATWNRIRVLDYESKFVMPRDLAKDEEHTVPETFEEQIRRKRFIADPCIERKLPELAPVLLWTFFDRYITLYLKQERTAPHEPEKVTMSTSQYRSNNDIFHQFIEDRVERITERKEAEKEFVAGKTMFTTFKDWYTSNYPGCKKTDIMDRFQMEKGLVKRLGRKTRDSPYGFYKTRWYGYRFTVKDEEEDFPDEGGSQRERLLKKLD